MRPPDYLEAVKVGIAAAIIIITVIWFYIAL